MLGCEGLFLFSFDFFNYYTIYVEVFPSLVLWRYPKQSESSLGLNMGWTSTVGVNRGQSCTGHCFSDRSFIPSLR